MHEISRLTNLLYYFQKLELNHHQGGGAGYYTFISSSTALLNKSLSYKMCITLNVFSLVMLLLNVCL